MTWPFATAEQRAEYDDLRRRGYALLAKAHALFMAAIQGRKA